MATLSIEHLSAQLHNRLVLSDISFSLQSPVALAIIGPSGSGKTTLAKAILGTADPLHISGKIIFNDQVLHDGKRPLIPLRCRKFGYIPQDLALWPHLTVKEALQLALKLSYRALPKWDEAWVVELIDLCGLEKILHQKPASLSGGEKQRLAIARALVAKPQLLVLDEPFSALDVVAKTALIKLVKNCQHLLGLATIFISHDLPETFALGATILILMEGKLQWIGDQSQIKSQDFSKAWNPLSTGNILNLSSYLSNQ